MMFSRFLSWLGKGSSSAPPPRVAQSAKPRSATGHLYQKKRVPAQSKNGKPAAADDFNPYNTGKFDRSASWEKISKSQR